MLQWLQANLATILLGAALLAIVACIVAGLVRKKKAGKSTCGCGCEHCAMKNACHSNKT